MLDTLFASLTVLQEAEGSLLSIDQLCKIIELNGEWHKIALLCAECIACCGFQRSVRADTLTGTVPLYVLCLTCT